MRFNAASPIHISDVKVTQVGNTAANGMVLDILNSNFVHIDNLFMQNTSQNNASNSAIFSCNGTSGIDIFHAGVSNNTNGPNVMFNNCGARNASGGQASWSGGFSDECTSPGNGCFQVLGGTQLNLYGATIFGEPTAAATGALYVDGTSAVWLSSMNVGPYSTILNSNGIGCASGAQIYSTGSHIRGGGTTGKLITGTCTFIDEGGNNFSRWNSTTGTTITAATYSGAFDATIAYKASITHTPNTCYAVTGALLATAQNLCTLLLDQNYQLLNITAQSGGTSPTAETCATPPVITLSDGTRSNTLTMTGTGTQTTWSVTGLSTVFASGATLTVSFGANTCATPATNVSVNYVLQSVLNP
jgi:hypothetical protein